MVNSKLIVSASIVDVQQSALIMKVYVNIGKYWKEGMSVNAAYDDLITKGLRVDRRTLSLAKNGTLSRSEYSTLISLRDWVREISGDKKISVEDILVIKEDKDG
jgi:hypothetical protein